MPRPPDKKRSAYDDQMFYSKNQKERGLKTAREGKLRREELERKKKSKPRR